MDDLVQRALEARKREGRSSSEMPTAPTAVTGVDTGILGDGGPLPFTDAFAFADVFFPDKPLYRWQIEVLRQLSGYMDPYDQHNRAQPSKENPMLYTLCAANGSGKDEFVLSLWALFCLTCKTNFHWIGTSSSYIQLHEQTWRHIEARARTLNKIIGPKFIERRKHKLKCARTGSEITLFRTDEDANTEGWHPISGGEMAIVLNECKSLEPEIVLAFKRCHGYTHWLNISSPGDPIGYFYERCMTPKNVWPQKMALGEPTFRKITVHDCPHLLAEFQRDTDPVDGFSIEHPYIQSSYLANFVETSKLRIIPQARLIYDYPAKSKMGLPRRAGLDLSLGGDATVLSVWEGNYQVAEITFRERHEPTLTRLICAKIEEMGLDANQVVADAGGAGTMIIQRIRDEGFQIQGIHNGARAKQPKVYVNAGSETAMRFARLITDKLLNLQGVSDKLKRQMTERLYFVKEGRIQLEAKPDFRARTGYSPDEFDAAILAHVNCGAYVFRSASVENKPAPNILGKQFQQEWESIYGKPSTSSTNTTNYRTSGVHGQGSARSALRRFSR